MPTMPMSTWRRQSQRLTAEDHPFGVTLQCCGGSSTPVLGLNVRLNDVAISGAPSRPGSPSFLVRLINGFSQHLN